MTDLILLKDNIWIAMGVFCCAAALVWGSGTRLTRYLDQIAQATGLNQAFAGMLLLGGITSLPEMAAVGTAAATGNAGLAINNLLGSVSLNVLVIALADVVLGRDAITSTVATPTTIMQGTLCMMILGLTVIGILSGEVSVGWVGLWSAGLMIACVAAFWISNRYTTRTPWVAADRRNKDVGKQEKEGGTEHDKRPQKLNGLIAKTIVAAFLILVGGFLLAQAGDVIAEKSGIGTGLVGLVLVGFATSLPEISTITEAVRRKRYEMALGDVFGTNLLTVAIIFGADLLYTDGPILAEAGTFEAVAALLGMLLTGIFLIGLLERRDKTVFRMGYDALAAITVFPAGLILLFFLQD